ncbi:MAG: MoxR family ATPase [Chloroflexi bacterium]|nr:MoxR family ATPase [Chloroflexota bacterium]MCI0805195.1 MoxR family ATPase [Chloroflexota bacterium]MCI0833640.1 MoxR family ATPase [Chloroflexota bacterium]MCI0851917.1 MoxR family ATPase [Chloroflexota bacterium]MCI0871278.1 MoxR family ATPase [Chloroflexota bacterium]
MATEIRESIQRVIVGKSEAIDLAVVALLCRGHVLLEDVPGTGKTTLAKALAASLDCQFGRIQFTPDLVPADVLGVNFYNMSKSEFEFRPGPVFSQVLLADEINRATPRTQSALLEAMQERQVSIDGVTSELPEPFMVMATLNPVEMEGTFPLPEAQLDRFMVRASLGYPEREEESSMLDRFKAGEYPDAIRPVATAGDILSARKSVDGVRVDDTVRDYLLDIIAKTRSSASLRLGASPRASLALQHAAQGRAAMNGRSYVLPDDVKQLAVPVLAHRLLAETTTQLRGQATAEIVREITESTPVPIERE